MSDDKPDRPRRPRLDSGARDRFLAQIARLEVPAASPSEPPGPSGLEDLRKAVLAVHAAVAPDARPGPDGPIRTEAPAIPDAPVAEPPPKPAPRGDAAVPAAEGRATTPPETVTRGAVARPTERPPASPTASPPAEAPASPPAEPPGRPAGNGTKGAGDNGPAAKDAPPRLAPPRPAGPGPAAPRPAETRPAETRPAETRPAETRPAGPGPAPLARVQSTGTPPAQPIAAPVVPPVPPSDVAPGRPDPQRSDLVAPPGPGAAPDVVGPAWAALRSIPVDGPLLERNLVITAARTDPAHGAFDVLRTRMVQAMRDRGWKRVGITSPTKGCGKSFTALNLAVALSRYGRHRSVLLDLDLRVPALARYLGVTQPGSIGDMLRGHVLPQDHLRRFADNGLRIGANVALGLNDRAEPYASELFQDPAMARTLARIDADLAPDLTIFDLPPALAQDDVIALRPHFDCILMVIGGGITTPREVREAVRRIGEDKPVLGMILNKADGEGVDDYAY